MGLWALQCVPIFCLLCTGIGCRPSTDKQSVSVWNMDRAKRKHSYMGFGSIVVTSSFDPLFMGMDVLIICTAHIFNGFKTKRIERTSLNLCRIFCNPRRDKAYMQLQIWTYTYIWLMSYTLTWCFWLLPTSFQHNSGWNLTALLGRIGKVHLNWLVYCWFNVSLCLELLSC